MDLDERRRRNQQLRRRLEDLDREIEAARREKEREEREKLDREARELDRLIASREATLAHMRAGVESREETPRAQTREQQRGSSGERQEPSDEREPQPSTSRDTQSWQTRREVHWERTVERAESTTDEECPEWIGRSPRRTQTKLVWSEVYSSSSSRTSTPKKRRKDRPSPTKDKNKREQDSKLRARAIVKLNRLEEVDTSLILGKKRRHATKVDVRSQLDTRNKARVRSDEFHTRWVGKETRTGSHHHRKTVTKRKIQETCRIKAQGVPPGEATLVRLERERRRKAMATAARKAGFNRIFRILSDSDLENDQEYADEPAPLRTSDAPAGGRVQQALVAGAATATTLKVVAEESDAAERKKRAGQRGEQRPHIADEPPEPRHEGTDSAFSRTLQRVQPGVEAGDEEVCGNLTELNLPSVPQPSEPETAETRPSEPPTAWAGPSKPVRAVTQPSELVRAVTEPSELSEPVGAVAEPSEPPEPAESRQQQGTTPEGATVPPADDEETPDFLDLDDEYLMPPWGPAKNETNP